jgi:hypothetical protein
LGLDDDDDEGWVDVVWGHNGSDVCNGSDSRKHSYRMGALGKFDLELLPDANAVAEAVAEAAVLELELLEHVKTVKPEMVLDMKTFLDGYVRKRLRGGIYFLHGKLNLLARRSTKQF